MALMTHADEQRKEIARHSAKVVAYRLEIKRLEELINQEEEVVSELIEKLRW